MAVLKTKLALTLMSCFLPLVAAGQVRYGQALNSTQSSWSGTGSAVSCVLSASLEGYGRADFTMYSGTSPRLSLELISIFKPTQGSLMRVISSYPEWFHGGKEIELGSIDLFPNFNPFFGDSVSWRILTALDQGREILFPYIDGKRFPYDIVVPYLSPLGFQKAYEEFKSCVAGLIPVSFADVAMNALLFKENEVELQPASRRVLDSQILYVTNDEAVNHISIVAFAYERDSSEGNQALAMQRANFLKQEFINAGFEADRIDALTYDDPGSSTLLQEDRIYSSRAVVRLDRDEFLIDPDKEAVMPDIGMPGAKLP